MDKLSVGQRFPNLEARATDGTTVALPAALSGQTAVVLLYRGHW